MTTVFDPWVLAPRPAYADQLKERVASYYNSRTVHPDTGLHLLKGATARPGDVMVTSNDYLSLSQHPDIVQAQVEVLRAIGHGEPRSNVFDFGDAPIRQLEKRLAAAANAEDALVAQSGWCANTGLLQSIASSETPVYIDMFAHMSLWEGIRSAGAQARPFRHNSAESLRKLAAKYGPGIVIVDSVYSTNGDVCPLKEIIQAAEDTGSIVIVDESHSLGIFGAHGEGMVVEQGLTERVHFRTASLSKAYAARGGVVLCSAEMAEYLRYRSLPAIFSSGLMPHEIAGLEATVDVIRREGFRREKVLSHARVLGARLQALGFDIRDDVTPIIALVAGPELLTLELRDALEARGVFGSVFCEPATPRNRSLVRLTLNADMSREDIDRIAEVCAQIRTVVRRDQWPDNRRMPLREAA
jgi:CAI-1 autoinducer synthase